MWGGGAGWFDAAGNPQPDTANKNQEKAPAMIDRLLTGELMALVRDDPAGSGCCLCRCATTSTPAATPPTPTTPT
jgi:hypothetical protein